MHYHEHHYYLVKFHKAKLNALCELDMVYERITFRDHNETSTKEQFKDDYRLLQLHVTFVETHKINKNVIGAGSFTYVGVLN